MAEKTTAPVYEVHFGYTDEEDPNPFVAIGPLTDGTYAGYLVDKAQLQEAWQEFLVKSLVKSGAAKGDDAA